MRMSITSSAGILSLLDEPEDEVKVFALNKLNSVVNTFWPEISEFVEKIEMLYEDATFKHRNLAALVASKVYYHLGAFEESSQYALGANELFDVNSTSEYVSTIVAKCIDYYTKQREQQADAADGDKKEIDPRLEAIVNRMFMRCFDDKQYKQAVGIALETHRVDIFEDAILQSDDVAGMLSYSLKVCMVLVQNRQFRNTLLRILVKLYFGLATPDYINVCQCLIFLDDPQAVADILEKLVKGETDQVLMAYQIGFDLYESATQQFLQRVQSALRVTAPLPIPASPPGSSNTGTTETESKTDDEKMETEESATASASTTTADSEDVKPSTSDESAKTEESTPPLTDEEKEVQDRFGKLSTILSGEKTIELHLQFLIRNNKADLLVLKNTKEAVRNSVCHNATVIANSLMHCGTTCDQFLRDNLEWLGRATNWAKFTAIGSLGTIHHGHEKQALELMSTYLPKDSGPGSVYSDGGGLYAMGLIHANHGGKITDYLLSQLKEATFESVRHGGCLGVGLAAMGTAREDVYEQLKSNLYQDDAVTGEAAGIAMGLVMLGTKSSQAIEHMVSYAQDTQHEKILRGLAVGIALTMYGRLEEADTLVESLLRDKDPILRWAAMYTLAMAYCGTANNRAIRKMLHVAVSDVNDDVRRVALISLGFLLFRTPEQCPSLVSLLSESYNPHVRYGAAMALGIACAGTGIKEALALLEPMVNDSVNYVRQASLIASAMILVQQNEVTCSKMKHYRDLYAKVIADKHEDVIAKFGAIVAQGIIDGGGRNVTLSLQSRTGHTNMLGVVGTLVFCQFWYWFPLTHFLSLAFTPTCVIALNSDLQMPKMEFRSGARPSQYAYPPPLEEKKDKHKEKVETAVLSTTARQKRKEKKDDKKSDKKDGGEEKMEVDEEIKDAGSEKSKDGGSKEIKEVEKKESKDQKKTSKEGEKKVTIKEDGKKDGDKSKDGEKKKVSEPSFEMLSNPARVMKQQLNVVTMVDGSKYIPVKDIKIGGIILMKNSKPEEEEKVIETVAASGPKAETEEDEPEPPEPFQWDE